MTTVGRPIMPALPRVIALGASLGAAAVATTSPSLMRGGVALAASSVLLAICLRSPKRTLVVLLPWLAALGTLRRILTPARGVGANDPLLLVAPAVVGLLLLVASRRGAFQHQTTFMKTVLVFCALLVGAALNPFQGGLAVGAGGLFFVLIPLLWFWVGRALLDDELLTRVLQVVAALSVIAAFYGLFQVYEHFPSWDQRWIDVQGYQALRIGTTVRAFSSFASSSDYVNALAVGIVLWALRMAHRRKRMTAALVIIPTWALVLASARGALVIVPVALGIVFAVSRGFGALRIALAAIAALFLLGFVASSVDPAGIGGGQTSTLLAHQFSGLSDPFNPDVSTLPVHVQSIVDGIKQAFHNPVGTGLGSITLAGERFGSANVSSEADPSNMAIAIGLPGLLIYAVVLVRALLLAFRIARTRRDYLGLAALGIVLVTMLQWLNGGNYFVAPLPWLVLGWLDRQTFLGEPEPGVVRSSRRGTESIGASLAPLDQ